MPNPLDKMFAKLFAHLAPTHGAILYNPRHDGRFHLLEARRGRGKSYGMTTWAYNWLVDMLPDMLAGKAPYSKLVTNFAIDPHRMALRLCIDGHFDSFPAALDLVHDRYIVADKWEDFFTRYRSGLFLDESNRSLNSYDRKMTSQLTLAHDFHQQSRKHLNTMCYATQYLDWINVQTRMLFDLLWRARVVRNKKGIVGPDGALMPDKFWYYGSDPMANGVGSAVVRRADYKFSLPFDLAYARMYQSWEPIVTFDSSTVAKWIDFKELADWMVEHNLKPARKVAPLDRSTLYASGHPVYVELPDPVPAPALVLVGGGMDTDARLRADGASLPPALDLSSLPVSFPKHLL